MATAILGRRAPRTGFTSIIRATSGGNSGIVPTSPGGGIALLPRPQAVTIPAPLTPIPYTTVQPLKEGPAAAPVVPDPTPINAEPPSAVVPVSAPMPGWLDQELIPGIRNLYLVAGGASLLVLLLLLVKRK